MNIDQLRQRLRNEQACRSFFESVLWQNGRDCPHCHAENPDCSKAPVLELDFANAINVAAMV